MMKRKIFSWMTALVLICGWMAAGFMLTSCSLFFSAKDKEWYITDYNFEVKFNYVKNTYKFWTVNHDCYNSFKISVNGTDITSSLKEERV